MDSFSPRGAIGFILTSWANIVFYCPIGQKKVTLGPLFRSKNDENRACVTKKLLNLRDGNNLCAKLCITVRRYAKVCQSVPICDKLCQNVPKIRTFYVVWHSLAQFDIFRHSYA